VRVAIEAVSLWMLMGFLSWMGREGGGFQSTRTRHIQITSP
jgi:hypothetical protein